MGSLDTSRSNLTQGHLSFCGTRTIMMCINGKPKKLTIVVWLKLAFVTNFSQRISICSIWGDLVSRSFVWKGAACIYCTLRCGHNTDYLYGMIHGTNARDQALDYRDRIGRVWKTWTILFRSGAAPKTRNMPCSQMCRNDMLSSHVVLAILSFWGLNHWCFWYFKSPNGYC